LSFEDPTALLMSDTLLAPLLARYSMIRDLIVLVAPRLRERIGLRPSGTLNA
jgi:hypothetical protein